uniref:Erythropoietin n=1 Tax=Oryzias sinensis TaxID=183150 RepID=A0A8C7XC52_9TELE
VAGLFALLLIVLEWTCPGLLSPLRPICDLRVLNHFVQEARDAEDAMRSCREGCGLTQTVSVPQTKVNIEDWEKKNALEQAEEVQTGLWLLQQALGSFGPSVTNTALNNHIDNTAKNLVSINAVLRSLNFQVRGEWDGKADFVAFLLMFVRFLKQFLDCPNCQWIS